MNKPVKNWYSLRFLNPTTTSECLSMTFLIMMPVCQIIVSIILGYNLLFVPTIGIICGLGNVSPSNSYQSNCHLLSVNIEFRMWLYDDLESERPKQLPRK